jgi:cell wall-associated NlpC family hydrolase
VRTRFERSPFRLLTAQQLASGVVAGTAALVLFASGSAVPVAAATPAHPASPANPTGNARERAHQLRQQLTQLQNEAELATEEYDGAQAQLGQVVAAHLLAERQLQDARNAVSGADAGETATVRALYRAGSTGALYATVFSGSDPGDVLSRLRAVQHLVSGQQQVATDAAGVVIDAASIEAHLADLAHQRTVLSTRASAAISRVQATLGRQQQLVAQADADVLRLEQAEAAQIAAASAAHASQTLDAARAAAVPGGPGDVAAPNTAVVDVAISAARQQLGKPYQWGATGPGSFDCSGLTGWAYSIAGVLLPRTSREQWSAGPHPGLGYLQPGDLLFWATNASNPASIHHVALYIGNDQMIAAPHSGADVTVQPVYLDGYIGAVRPTAAG